MGMLESKRTHAVLLSLQRSSRRLGGSGEPHPPQAHVTHVCPEGAQEVRANGPPPNYSPVAELTCYPSETKDLPIFQEEPETQVFTGSLPIFKNWRHIQVSKRHDVGQEKASESQDVRGVSASRLGKYGLLDFG